MSFKITNDDVGVRGLQEGNKTPVVSGPVMPVKASNPVQKSPENSLIQPQKVDHRHKESSQEERRQLDRRKIDTPMLLDTRSQHERRKKNTRSDDTETNKTIETRRGIDEEI